MSMKRVLLVATTLGLMALASACSSSPASVRHPGEAVGIVQNHLTTQAVDFETLVDCQALVFGRGHVAWEAMLAEDSVWVVSTLAPDPKNPPQLKIGDIWESVLITRANLYVFDHAAKQKYLREYVPSMYVTGTWRLFPSGVVETVKANC
jgi:hypothetical protein